MGKEEVADLQVLRVKAEPITQDHKALVLFERGSRQENLEQAYLILRTLVRKNKGCTKVTFMVLESSHDYKCACHMFIIIQHV